MKTLLFPDEPRSFRGRRALKILFRAFHVLCAGVLVGAHVLGAGAGPWLGATIATGSLILLLDLHETAAFVLQVRGLIVLAKLSLLAALPWFEGGEVWVLGFLLVGSVLSSHAPAKFRHRQLFGRGAVTGSTSSG